MAVKGQAYTKTTWAFEERPVASSKLNLWDDRVEAAIELIHFLLSQAWGGGSGVIRGATEHDLEAVAMSPPGLSAEVNSGYAFIERFPYKLDAATETAEVTAPASDPRIDLVQARLATWDVGVKEGMEAATPVAPEADEGCIAVAELYLRAGMTCIKDADDGVNGYVTDSRQFV